MLHSFKTRKIKSRLMAIKLDLQKAYNRMNWKFSMQCFSSSISMKFSQIGSWLAYPLSLRFLLMVGNLRPSRGLWQGGLCLLIFSSWGKKHCRRCLSMNFHSKTLTESKQALMNQYIMYANDIVLFSKATRREASAIVERILTSIVGGLAKA